MVYYLLFQATICARSNPCQNGATCRSLDAPFVITPSQNVYRCDCPRFYTGRNCEIGKARI